MNATDLVDRANLRDDIPDFAPGDTLKVHVRVVEGNRERVQVFQGVVIRRKGGGVRETFTVRKVSFGVGVERTFPVHSPIIAKIEVVTRGDVRRAKLYYLRDRIGKAAKVKEKRLVTAPPGRVRYGHCGSAETESGRVSAEDLERYETEIELQLYKEYRDVLPMFAYVVETERRFYLTNEVKMDVRNEQGQRLLRARAAGRLGLGHVPPGALRRQRPRRDVQGRQHRGARGQGPLVPTAAPSERVLQHVDEQPPALVPHHRSDVEAQRTPVPGMGMQPAQGERPQPPLLARRHRLERRAECVAGAGLDLAEHDRAGACEHEVELTVAAAPVPVDDVVAGAPVPRRDQRLAGRAESEACGAAHRGHHHPRFGSIQRWRSRSRSARVTASSPSPVRPAS